MGSNIMISYGCGAVGIRIPSNSLAGLIDRSLDLLLNVSVG